MKSIINSLSFKEYSSSFIDISFNNLSLIVKSFSNIMLSSDILSSFTRIIIISIEALALPFSMFAICLLEIPVNSDRLS